MKAKIVLIAFLFFFIFFPQSFAEGPVTINEFSSGTSDSDWVEIYNSDSTSLDLSNYILRDSTSSNKIELSGTIAGNGFATFNWSNRLNNDGDTIRLLLKSDESVVDKIIYGKEGDIPAPSGTQTAGRNPDGSSSWVFLSSSSKGGSNNSASPISTLTPTPSPNPTPTPAPTKITPTKPPTKTASVPTKVSATPTSIQKISSLIPSAGQVLNAVISPKINIPTSVLGQSTKSATATPTPKVNSTKKDVKVLGSNQNNIFRILIVIGIAIFVFSCAILLFQHFKNKNINNE